MPPSFDDGHDGSDQILANAACAPVPPVRKMEMPVQTIAIWTPSSLVIETALAFSRLFVRAFTFPFPNGEQARSAAGE